MKKVVSLLFALLLIAVCSACSNRKSTSDSADSGAIWKAFATPDAAPDATPEPPKFHPVAVGDMVTFGSYEQDGNPDNGEEPIEWIVLDVQIGKALLLSRYGLDVQSYNQGWSGVTWETCTLRTWLNSSFLDKAFSAEEQAMIQKTRVRNDLSQGYLYWSSPELSRSPTTGGSDTEDKVFLLSYGEANRYLGVTPEDSDNVKARIAPTAYAISRKAWTKKYYLTEDGHEAGSWWLRSPGHNFQEDAAVVDCTGALGSCGVYNDGSVIRPAIWINVQSAEPLPGSDTDQPAAAAKPSTFILAGDMVTFGRYEQDNKDNGAEPIEWTVLDVRDGKALLLSRYGLAADGYNNSLVDITWETCSLRTRLNGEFLDTAFSKAEQAAIITTNVDNSDEQGYWEDTVGGNNTQDKVFLLSCAEAKQYLGVNDKESIKPRVAPTAFAVSAHLAWTTEKSLTADGDPAGVWWLRSPGRYQSSASCVRFDGSFTSVYSNYATTIVRPALWVKIDSGLLSVVSRTEPGTSGQ